MKRRAAVGIVCGPEFSSMRGNDGTAHRKAQPHAFLFVVKKGSKICSILSSTNRESI